MKRVLLLGLLLVSPIVFADATTVAKLDYFPPDYHFPLNTNITFWSSHDYTIINNTAAVQHISVCFDIVTCPEQPQWTRSTRDCRSFDLAPGQSKSDHKGINVTVNYPFRGWCKILAQTETTGGTYSKTQDNKQFYMWS